LDPEFHHVEDDPAFNRRDLAGANVLGQLGEGLELRIGAALARLLDLLCELLMLASQFHNERSVGMPGMAPIFGMLPPSAMRSQICWPSLTE
jgi:hypothetical protein